MPFHHIDTIKFLKAVKKELKPDRVICLGDEIDNHSITFHDAKDPDLFSPGKELELAKKKLSQLFDVFPVVDVLESNHTSLFYRKQKFHGLPRGIIKDYGDILESPKTWRWFHDLTIKLPNGTHCYFHHGIKSNITLAGKNRAMNIVQGHYHSKFKIEFWANPIRLFWAMQLGCLIDDRARSFEYNKLTLERPILGVGFIRNGFPRLMPMVLNSKLRWVGKVF
jgi:hypothetical protein